jgi:hypothetical protein
MSVIDRRTRIQLTVGCADRPAGIPPARFGIDGFLYLPPIGRADPRDGRKKFRSLFYLSFKEVAVKPE